MRKAPARVSGPSARVQEELGPIAPVEVRPPEREVAAYGFRGRASERDDPLLPALSHDADDPRVDVHTHSLEAHRLGDAEACAVEELHERPVAEGAGRRPRGGLDETLGLGRRERPRQRSRASR